MKAVRSQADDDQDTYSAASALDCSESKDMTRQEFKDEADINIILGRFGVDAFQAKQPLFGETDFDIDLQQALAAIATAKEVHRGLPKEIRALYPSWRTMLNAANSGDLKRDMDKYEEHQKPKVVPPVPDPKTEPATKPA